jgi:serine phosphatase RsbU (regulator of sigma subunit)
VKVGPGRPLAGARPQAVDPPRRPEAHVDPARRAGTGTDQGNVREAGRASGLVVGRLPAAVTTALETALDLDSVSPDDARAAAASGAFDILLLDGGLSEGRLRSLLESSAVPDAGERPAVLVVFENGRRPALDQRLLGDAGDFADGSLGGPELLGRVRTLLRFRCCLSELSRKNGELEALYGRLEGMVGRMAEELRLASNVQRSLLPPPLDNPRLEVASEFIPFREIGGDYYDLVPLAPGRLAFAIGDVMGKGVPAALLAANLKAALRAQLLAEGGAVEEVLARVNRLFWEVTPKGRFASLFFAVLDLDAGIVEYVNAGHDYPLRLRANGSLEELREGGTVLGLVESSRYERGRAALEPGDLLIFYSDGLIDRSNLEGELYGPERLKEAALRCRRDSARITLYTLLGEAQGWSAGRSAEDDITLVVMKVR